MVLGKGDRFRQDKDGSAVLLDQDLITMKQGDPVSDFRTNEYLVLGIDPACNRFPPLPWLYDIINSLCLHGHL